MKLYGAEVPPILFLRWWLIEFVMALLGGYFGSKGFYPESLLFTGFLWLGYTAFMWLGCTAYRSSDYCLTNTKMWALFFAIVPVSNIFVWIVGLYPYSATVISLLWTLLLFWVGLKMGAWKFLAVSSAESK